MIYTFSEDKSTPIYVQLYQKVRADIELGILKSGEKLPSKRMLAQNSGISVITVENAYGQLVAEGYIQAVPKKGFYVAKIADLTDLKLIKVKRQEKYIDAVCDENSADISVINDTFPFSVWAKLMREELSCNREKLLTKTTCGGVYELRSAIAQHVRSFRGMEVNAEQIIVGAGTEYLYMMLVLLLGRKNIYAAEEPGYTRIRQIYESNNVACRYVDVKHDGIDMDKLRESHADIIHISPSHHFPTGVVTSISRRYELLGWAAENANRYIIEDDYDSEFRLAGKPVPSLYGIDVADRVIYMNTFSKSLAPTIRISYMILPKSLMKQFHERLGFYSCTVSNFEQYTLARFISEGYFEKHINRMRRYYRERRKQIMAKISENSFFDNAKILQENSGLHFLIKFATDMPDTELLDNVRGFGFNASCLSTYYSKQPHIDTHTLVIDY